MSKSRYAIVVTCEARVMDACVALTWSAAAACPDIDVIVLAAQGPPDDVDGRIVGVDEVNDSNLLVTKILRQTDQLAFGLPRVLQRLLEEYEACVVIGPGMLLRGEPAALLSAALEAGVAFASPVSVQTIHSDTRTLSPLELGPRSQETRVMAVSREGADFLADWSTVTLEAIVDIEQRPVSHLSDTFLLSSIGRRDVTIEGERTLIHWTNLAALGGGRAEGPDCPVVECDELFAAIREHEDDEDQEVDWSLLVHKVHDSRPVESLYKEIRAGTAAAAKNSKPETPFDVLRADIRRAADCYGHHWTADDDRAFDAWLFEENAAGLTRIAHAVVLADDEMFWRFPDARLNPAPLRDWWEMDGEANWGFNAFDRNIPPRVVDRDHQEEPGGLAHALRWRWMALRGLAPAAARREQARELKRLVGPDPGPKRGVAPPKVIEVVRTPLPWGATPRSLNLIGCFRSESGLGQAARASLGALNHLGYEFSHIDTSERYPSRNSIEVDLSTESFGQSGEVNLIHSNADEMLTMARGAFKHRFAGRFNAAMWFWEPADLPARSLPAFQIVDELWVASNYLRDVFGQYARVPVHVVGLAADLPPTRPAQRDKFGLAEDELVFLFVYDALSSYGRKNPRKALDAFINAFSPNFESVRFVLKVTNLNKFPASQREILGLAELYPTITVIDDYLEREEVLDLMASSDVYVSLHAAEGYGLTLLEAMSLGTPTICTGYSGNMDFTTKENSWLVDYTMMATSEQTGPYPPGSVWASPDVESVSEIMRAVAADRAQIAGKARLAEPDAREAASIERYARRLDAQLKRVL